MAWPPGLVRIGSGGTSLVDEQNQINVNWDTIDTSFSSLVVPGATTPSVAGTPTYGTEWVSDNGTYFVYTEDGWVTPTFEIWGAWQTLPITQSPYVSRTADPTQIRISNLGNVEMKGAIQADTNPAIGFPDTGYQLVHQGLFGSPYLPGVTEVFPAAMQDVGSGFVNGQIYLTVLGPPYTLAIFVLPQGTRDTTTNFIVLDQVRYQGS